jgi:hypothetical protein
MRSEHGMAESDCAPAPCFVPSKFIAIRTHHLPGLCTLLYVGDKFLLRGLELCAFTVQLTLRLGERALVLPQPLGGGDCTPK